MSGKASKPVQHFVTAPASAAPSQPFTVSCWIPAAGSKRKRKSASASIPPDSKWVHVPGVFTPAKERKVTLFSRGKRIELP